MLNVICPPHIWDRHRRTAAIAPALLIYGRIERTGGAVNLVAAALRPLRHLPATGAVIASRDFR
jgi:error-prone DNA polymerase